MQRFSHFRLAILTAVLGGLLTLIIATVLFLQDNRQIRDQLRSEAVELQNEIGRQLQTHLFGLTWVARHDARYRQHNFNWLEEGDVVLGSYPHFNHLIWLDQDLDMLGVYPDGSERSQALHIPQSSQLAESLRELESGVRYILPAGPLAEHTTDVVLVLPFMRAEGATYYLGVIDMQQLLQRTVTSYINEFSQFRVTSLTRDEVVFDYSQSDELRDNWAGTVDFEIFEQSWRMELWPTKDRLTAMRSWLPLLVIVAGGVTTALLTFVLYVLGVSRVRAQELADTNLDLYVEIDERERVEKKMAYLAEHDRLTDLANRNALMEKLEEFFAESLPCGKHVGALFIDLDSFKEVNDALGHSVGDQLLKRVASRLTKLLPENGCLARMGGDEFVLAIPNVETMDKLESLTNEILQALDTHFYVDDYEIFISGSIGVALSQPEQDTPESLIRNADTALYRAKEYGRNTYHVYSTILHDELNRRMELMKRLRHAVEQDHLEVYYQPKVDMHSRRIIGAEALVRWIDTDGSVIGPDQFIPIAEDTGLIIPISEFVLKTACKQLAAWHALGFTELRMAVNLSGKQLQSPDLVEQIMKVVTSSGIPATSLELELTEQVFIENIQSHTNFMHAARERGISLAIDDFGMGYSSLSYLKHFPVTCLKIDRSFVQDLPHDKDDATLTQTIINLAKSLEIGLVAEGVETEDQVEFLLDRDCTIGQGFLFSRPVPHYEFTKLLNDYQGQIPIQIM
jgi:diguanylate cyclase (GGDEF)-like protein